MTTTLTVNGVPVTLPDFHARVPASQRERDSTVTQWVPGDARSCDVWVAARALGPGQWLLEGEVSNASFAPGVPARPQVRCKVKLETPPSDVAGTPSGWSVGHDLDELPDVLGPQRAALWRALVLAPGAEPYDVAQLDVPLPKWSENYGPLGARVARDPYHDAGEALEEGYRSGGLVVHRDSGDALNVEGFRQFGRKARGEPGGTGLWFAYTWNDLRAVRLIVKALHNRGFFAYDRRTGEPITVEYYGDVTPPYDGTDAWLPEFKDVMAGVEVEFGEHDPAHRQRQDGYVHDWWAMSKSPLAERLVVHAGERCRLMFSERGPVKFDPGWVPANVHQLHEEALRHPHQGLNDYAGRWAGWLGWSWAWRMLARPRGCSRAFGQVFLNALELGASQTHGFVQRGKRVMPAGPDGAPLEVSDVAQCFEVGILAHAALGIARLSGQPTPIWPQRAASALYELAGEGEPVFTYEGMRTPPHILQWQPDGTLAPAPGTDGDPAFGWYVELCAALYLATRNQNFLMMSCRYHAVAPSWNQKVALMAEFTHPLDLAQTAEARGIGALK